MFAKSLPLLPVALMARLASLLPVRSVPARGADELMGMSDRELTDLGIGRSEIPHVLDEECREARQRLSSRT